MTDAREFDPADEDLRGVGRRIGFAAASGHDCLAGNVLQECDCRVVAWLHDAPWEDIERAIRTFLASRAAPCLRSARMLRQHLRAKDHPGPMWFSLRHQPHVGVLTRNQLRAAYGGATDRHKSPQPNRGATA